MSAIEQFERMLASWRNAMTPRSWRSALRTVAEVRLACQRKADCANTRAGNLPLLAWACTCSY